MTPQDPAAAFVALSRRYLCEEYLSKIEHCLDALPPGDLWWRPNESSNSIGNLLRHLDGNVRQWLLHGVGGAADVRDRPAEFASREGHEAASLLDALRTTLGEVDALLAGLDPAVLHEERTLQGQRVTVLEAIYHVVEHFASHVGQIIYITKLRTGQDLAFYRVEGDVATPNWRRLSDQPPNLTA